RDGEYKVNIKDNKQKTIRTLTQPENSKEFYVPKLPPAKLEPSEYSTVQVFAKIKKQGDKLIINQKNLKEVFYIEELDHELYPFKPDLIKYQDKNFVLNKKLDCKVSYEDENYIIHNEELDLTVWGESRKEVEEAFYFSFLSLYENYYNESDSNLSAAALILKGKLKDIINKVEDEA
ncbi:MAG: hypothetical protein IAE91_12730, partial [Ignavibacteriaceae bacterium]|nr:hypothetical protein [Ignavibacteriaceae bacterium]